MNAHTLAPSEIERLCDDLLGDCATEEDQFKLRVMRDMAIECFEARIKQRPEGERSSAPSGMLEARMAELDPSYQTRPWGLNFEGIDGDTKEGS